MGKGEIYQNRVYLILKYYGKSTSFIETDQIIFKIPANAPTREQAQILTEQVEIWLTLCANAFDSYQNAILVVQGWLKSLIGVHPDRREWIEMGAEEGGKKFLDKVRTVKRQKGKIISVDVKSLMGGMFNGSQK